MPDGPWDDRGERRKRGFVAELTDDDRDDLVAMGRPQRYRAGSIVMNEGDVSGRVLMIQSGRIKVYSVAESGHETLLAIRTSGDLVGELSAIDGQPHSATVSALDHVQAIVLSASRFREFLATHPNASQQLLHDIASRLRDADRKRVEFGAFDSVGRVAARLVEMAERFGTPVEGGVRIDIGMSQDDLASWIGCARESVAKALRQLRERGWVTTNRRAFVVSDLDALRGRAT
jgi:CRP/FNR family cyclic AMP-dependent transcriptional regulator